MQPRRSRGRRPLGSRNNGLRRAIQYLGRYRKQASLPYLFLIVATLSQLAVPRLVRNILDAVTRGALANAILPRLQSAPAGIQENVLQQIGTTLEQLLADQSGAERALFGAGLAILVFAALRGLFAFLQAYWAERNSQNVAFEMRNDLFAKIQRLSFSYHDRNQTGQLMIRPPTT